MRRPRHLDLEPSALLQSISGGARSWQNDALCGEPGYDSNDWFPSGAGASKAGRRAVAVCGQCSVQRECLRYAITLNLEGVWGGTTLEERRRLIRQEAKHRLSEAGSDRARH
jgi:WhiB family transcriptional regulator, redox-sensing transcriptional regulator